MPRAGRYVKLCVGTEHNCGPYWYELDYPPEESMHEDNRSSVGLVVNGTPRDHR